VANNISPGEEQFGRDGEQYFGWVMNNSSWGWWTILRYRWWTTLLYRWWTI